MGRSLFGARQRHVVARQQGSEERLQAEVVLLQQRIELVIVAASAAQPQPEEHVGRHVGDVVERIGPLAAHVPLVVFVDALPQVAGGREGLGVVGRDLVAG
jgi:hypothetical protein